MTLTKETPPTAGSSEPDLKVAATRGVLWSVANAWGTRLMALLVFVVLGRKLPASAFGVMAMAVAVVEFGRLLVDQGFSRNIVQRKDLNDEHLDTAFWTAVGTGALLSVLGVMLSPVVADAFDEPDLAPVLRVMSVIFVLNALTCTQLAVMQRALRFKGMAARRLISVGLGGVVGIVVALLEHGVWALVAQQVVQNGVEMLVLWSVSDWRPGFRFYPKRFREMVGFATTTLGSELIGYFARRGDDLLIGAFLGATTLGFFNVAYRVIIIVIDVFTSTINVVAFPVFSRMQGDPDRIRNALHTATRMSSAVAFPAFLGLSVMAPNFLPLLFGDKWEPSIDVLRVLCIVGLLRSVTYFNRSLLLALGKPRFELFWVCFSVVTKVLAFVIGYRWGLMGVAWAVVAHGYAIFPVGVWLINKANPIDPATYLRQFLRPLAASLIMVIVVLPMQLQLDGRLPRLPILIIGSVVGGAVYVGALFVVAPTLTAEIIDRGRDVVPKRFRKKVVTL